MLESIGDWRGVARNAAWVNGLCMPHAQLSMCSARAPERPAAAPPVDDTLEDLYAFNLSTMAE
jgi:hypothetical protein